MAANEAGLADRAQPLPQLVGGDDGAAKTLLQRFGGAGAADAVAAQDVSAAAGVFTLTNTNTSCAATSMNCCGERAGRVRMVAVPRSTWSIQSAARRVRLRRLEIADDGRSTNATVFRCWSCSQS